MFEMMNNISQRKIEWIFPVIFQLGRLCFVMGLFGRHELISPLNRQSRIYYVLTASFINFKAS